MNDEKSVNMDDEKSTEWFINSCFKNRSVENFKGYPYPKESGENVKGD